MDAATQPASQRATQRIDRWKRSLLDLTLRNRLLDARDSQRSLTVAVDDVMALARVLESGAALRLESFLPPGRDAADEVAAARAAEALAHAAKLSLAEKRLLVPLSAAELERRLVTIARAAAASLSDGGVHTLWLGLGLLEWQDDEGKARAAPLALWPVTLSRPSAGERYRLTMADEEPRENLTLFEKLRVDHGITLAAAGAPLEADPGNSGSVGELSGDDATVRTAAAIEEGELDLPGLMARLARAVAHKPGWRVVASARLGVFSFAKLVMWTDLDERAERLLESRLVAHLARSQGEAFRAAAGAEPAGDGAADEGAAMVAQELPDPETLDERVPVGSLLLPLDADASQLAAIAAASGGRTFVLQGPPGTGKSQTIANLICHVISEGKSVLFVSEKMAALEVVQRRLAAAGLGDFCLELHSHKARRKEVVEQLGKVIERTWRPGSLSGGDEAKLSALRTALDGYAAAMHRPGPLGKSPHELLARLVELREAPRHGKLAGELAGLDEAGLAARLGAVSELARAAQVLGPLAEHPWRGSQLAEWQLTSAEKVTAAIDEAEAASGALVAAMAAVEQLVPGLRAQSAKELLALARLCEVAASSPRPTAELVDAVARLREEGTQLLGAAEADKLAAVKAASRAVLPVRRPVPRPTEPQKYLELARRHRAIAQEVDSRFLPVVDEVDVAALAATFRAWAGRFFLWRFFALRRPRAQVRALLAQGGMPDDEALAGELDKVAGERALRAALEASRQEAERWFGGKDLLQRGAGALDLERGEAQLGWASQLAEAFGRCAVAEGHTRDGVWRALLAQLSSTGDGAAELELAPFSALASAVGRWTGAELALAAATGTAASDGGARHLEEVAAACQRWRPAVSRLRDHTAYVRAKKQAETAGVTGVAAALEAGEVTAEAAPLAWERAILLAHCEQLIDADPALRDFHGATHHGRITEFGELDRATLVMARSKVVARLAERVPKVSADAGGEVGALLHELKKQRRHKPLRQLFRAIPTLLPRLKPCLLMSPLSVAQYLDPALPRFDLVVFDEASQIPTADAIGALARGEHALIVGDSKQLPPTRFFEVGEDAATAPLPASSPSGEAGEEEEPYEELESVLDESVAARLPQLWLRWHYRSRHEDLIGFSNRRYYDDQLHVMPAASRTLAAVPTTAEANAAATAAAGDEAGGRAAGFQALGVSLRQIEGVYERSGSRTNRKEAEAVVAEVLARLRDPAAQRRSIGVVTFSRAQQALIEDLIDEALRQEPALERFFATEASGGSGATAAAAEAALLEPVLVKNLESVQGDERDVMLFSTGYGPDASGKLTLGMGPLSREGGERRLNVAATRAREQLIIFSSLEPEQLTGAGSLGVRHLGELLAYARAGGGSALPPAGTGAASAICAALATALEARGHKVVHQLGCAGYRIDLAIVDPNDPRRYVLAIETDGPAYAASKVARDRDRLRGHVMAQLGWRMHRIWALDFFSDPEKEITRAHGAIIAATAASRSKRTGTGAGASSGGSGPASRVARESSSPSSAPAARAASAPSAAAPDASRATDSTRARSDSSRPTDSTRTRADSSRPTDSTRTRADSSRPTDSTRARSDSSRPVSAPMSVHSAITTRTGSGPALSAGSVGITPYAVANVPAGRRAPGDLHSPKHASELGKVIEQVLAAEAPMRIDLLVRRVAAYFGIARVSAKVIEEVRGGLGSRVRWGEEPDVLWRADQDPSRPPPVRAQAGTPASRRDIEDVPLVELAAAARLVVERAVGIEPAELTREIARLLGYGRATDRVLARIDAGVSWARDKKAIVVEDDRARLP
jgi:very-short-patch-repair endonuclease